MSNYNELDAWAGERPTVSLEGSAEEESRKWSARKRIYLEGKTDYEIIAVRWFHSDDKIEFKTHIDDSGGCKWVLKQVEEQEGSFGIIDRDYLLNSEHYDIFFETDDNNFKEKNPFRPNILILSRYEIENYLVDVSNLLRLIINRKRNIFEKKCTINNENDLAGILIQIALKIASVDSICSVFELFREEIPEGIKNLHHSKKYFSEGKSVTDALLNKWVLERCELKNEPELTNLIDCIYECNDELKELYKSFILDEKISIHKKLNSLLRIINGKRLFDLIRKSFGIRDPIEYELADNIAYHGSIPEEVGEFISSVKYS